MAPLTQKELYGLIGYPVKHSYSAFMHNAAFAHYHMNAEYRLFEVSPEKLDEFFKKTIIEKKIKGFNITVPYKEETFAYLKKTNATISGNAQQIAAINTVVVEKDGSLRGFNTDADGFLRDLKEYGVGIKNKNISLIGAGGGAKAVAYALAWSRPKQFFVFDVDQEKSKALANAIKNVLGIKVTAVDSMEELKIDEADILINATPIGMKPGDPLLIKKEWLHPKSFVYDLIYNPSETKLLKVAKEVGCPCANGSGMLLYQGCLAFTHWTAKEAPVEVMRQALLERLNG